MIVLKIMAVAAVVLAVLFVLSLLVYFFNLDMKLSAKLIPFMNRHYDKIKRDTRL